MSAGAIVTMTAKKVARVAGDLNLMVERKQLTRYQLEQAAAELREASRMLTGVIDNKCS